MFAASLNSKTQHMIKIYIQQSILILATKNELDNIGQHFDAYEVLPFRDKEMLERIIKKCEHKKSIVCILNDDLEKLKKVAFSCFNIHIAGGGLVLQPSQEILMMFRRGFWDLPKGHQEKGESIEETSLREVMEETGLKRVKLGNPILINEDQQNITYHTYRDKKDKHVLKVNYWFEMFTDADAVLIPQTEEDIEKIEWINLIDSDKYLSQAYASIVDVVNAYVVLLKP